MTPVSPPSNFFFAPLACPPLQPVTSELLEMARQLFSGELQGQAQAEARLALMQWLASGSTVALNCIFVGNAVVDVRAKFIFADRCYNMQLLAPEPFVDAMRKISEDDALDAPLPSADESPAVRGVADWFQGLRA